MYVYIIAIRVSDADEYDSVKKSNFATLMCLFRMLYKWLYNFGSIRTEC